MVFGFLILPVYFFFLDGFGGNKGFCHSLRFFFYDGESAYVPQITNAEKKSLN